MYEEYIVQAKDAKDEKEKAIRESNRTLKASRGANVNPFSTTTKLTVIVFLNYQNFQKCNRFGYKVHLFSQQGMCRYGRAVGSGLLTRLGHCGCNHLIEYILPSFDAALEYSAVKVLK
jgi:hypothetical protein